MSPFAGFADLIIGHIDGDANPAVVVGRNHAAIIVAGGHSNQPQIAPGRMRHRGSAIDAGNGRTKGVVGIGDCSAGILADGDDGVGANAAVDAYLEVGGACFAD